MRTSQNDCLKSIGFHSTSRAKPEVYIRTVNHCYIVIYIYAYIVYIYIYCIAESNKSYTEGDD